jgi:transcriptional regulator with XRE-family HTH domain
MTELNVNHLRLSFSGIVPSVAETLGERFSQAMDKAMLDVADVARTMGVTESYVYKIRRGEVKDIGFASAMKFARRANVSPWLLAGIAEHPAAAVASDTDESLIVVPRERLEAVETGLERLNQRLAELEPRSAGPAGPRPRRGAPQSG